MEIESEPNERQSKDLLILARDGDGNALGVLLDIYRHYLAVLARTQIGRRLQGKADASDLVQETLLEAHRHFRDFRGSSEGEFVAWLRSILAGLIANHVRRYLGTKRRDARLERTLAVELSDASGVMGAELAADVSSPSEQAVNHEASLQLANALEKLPDHYREVIMFRHLEGLPFAQVAERMGRTVESVEKLWVRALARLRQTLGASHE
ncbi:MAG TPA: sigma-70 family RNA polymerase sigma factor [Pirellulales bacterium]|jgi:RNA polymerase sigma-70 factor (ECF subfamily)|nr:sigma-70 family RNA polymerase sigma factor [Pirellulales bacterium]